MERNEENCKPFGDGRKVLLPYNFSSRNKTTKHANKQTNKDNLPTLTVSYEKRSCLIRSKKKQQNNNNTKKKKKRKEKRKRN